MLARSPRGSLRLSRPAGCPSPAASRKKFTLWPSTDQDPPGNTAGPTGDLGPALAALPPPKAPPSLAPAPPGGAGLGAGQRGRSRPQGRPAVSFPGTPMSSAEPGVAPLSAARWALSEHRVTVSQSALRKTQEDTLLPGLEPKTQGPQEVSCTQGSGRSGRPAPRRPESLQVPFYPADVEAPGANHGGRGPQRGQTEWS